VQFDKAHIEGITQARSGRHSSYAEQLGYRIKLLGITRRKVPMASNCACIRR
jgi:homoserine dehydrogenase